jgi:hypothetical protein
MHNSLRRIVCGLAFAAAALTPSAWTQAQPYDWKNVEIRGGGFVTGVVFHPSVPDLVYARTDVGGAYRWDAATGRWIALNDDIGGLNNEFMTQGVLSLALDPTNPHRVYLATGQYTQWWAPNASLLISTNKGANWTKVPLPFKLGGNEDGRSTGERLQVDPNQPRILYLGTNKDGLWRSADHGRNWRQVTSFPQSNVTFVLFDKTSSTYGRPSSTMYVGVQPAAGQPSLYVSNDAGTTWSPVAGQPVGLVPHHAEIGYAAQKLLYVAYSDSPGPNGATTGAVWKLNLATSQWTNITPPTGQGGFAGLSVDASNPNTLVVTTLNRWWPRDELYRSTNAGATWTTVFDNAVWDNSSAPWSIARNPHWVGDVDIDPTNPNRVIFVTGYGLWASNNLMKADANQVTNWTFLNTGLEETVPLSLASPTSGIFHLVSSLGDIGGFRHRYLLGSPPLVDYFAPYRGTTPSIAVAENDANKFVRTVWDNSRGQYSTDAGASWVYFATSAAGATTNGPGHITVSPNGQRIVWIPERSAASYSWDNGLTWHLSAGAPAANPNYSYRPTADRVNSDKFYIYDRQSGTVYRSLDGGVTFTPGATNLPTTGDYLESVHGLEGNLWLPAWTNGLYRSTDSGFSFVPVTSVQEAYKIGFGQAAPNQSHPAIYIWGKVNNTVGFFRSDNGGNHWTRINDDRHQYGYINHMVGDPRVYGRVYLATSGRGIIYGQPAGLVTDHEVVDPNDPVFHAPPDKPIYTDYKHAPWDIWWWGVDQNQFSLTNTAPLRSGSYSIRAPFTESWGQIYLNRTPFSTAGLVNLKLWVHGGTAGGQGIAVSVVRQGDIWGPAYRIPKGMVQPNTWTQVVIPLTALNATNLPDVQAIAIGVYDFDYSNPTPTFYLDDIVLE